MDVLTLRRFRRARKYVSPPLPSEKDLRDLGARVLVELLVFLIVSGLVVYEFRNSSNASKEKERLLQQRLRRLEENVEWLKQREMEEDELEAAAAAKQQKASAAAAAADDGEASAGKTGQDGADDGDVVVWDESGSTLTPLPQGHHHHHHRVHVSPALAAALNPNQSVWETLTAVVKFVSTLPPAWRGLALFSAAADLAAIVSLLLVCVFLGKRR
jgi:hypothetical protein